MKISNKRLFIYLLWPFILGVIILLSTPLWFPHLGYYLVVSDPLQKSDAIVPLGGGDPQRFVVAAELFRKKWAPLLITVGSLVPDYAQAMENPKTCAELGATFLAKNGAPEDRVLILNEGTSTIEEATAIKEYSLKHQFKSVIVVTSIYHTRRSRAVYRKVFADSGIKIIVRPAEGGKFSTEKWWTREEDLIFVNNEWMKTILYLLQGKI